MTQKYELIRNKYYAKFAKKYTGQLMNVYRPNYALTDTTLSAANLVIANLYVKAEKAGSRLAIPSVSGLEYYAVFGDLRYMLPGDILVPQESSSSTPKLTFLNKSPVEEAVAFETNRTGSIRNGSEVLFTGIPFEFMSGSGFPGSPLQRELESSLGIPTRKIVIWERALQTATRDSTGLLFVEDESPNVRWTIKEAEPDGTLLILTCGEALIT